MIYARSEQGGFTMVELIVAATVLAIISGVGYKIAIKQFETMQAENNRQSAKIVARMATQFLKDRFKDGAGVMTIVADASRSVVFGSSPLSPTYSLVENTCITPPSGEENASPSYATLPDCPAACPKGKVPQIKVTFKKSGATAERVFPTSFSGLYGAIVCSRQFPTLMTFPVTLRAANYGLMVYVGWRTNRGGTSEPSLWRVDGAFLLGGGNQNVIIKDHTGGSL